jgi:hypothetical protein
MMDAIKNHKKITCGQQQNCPFEFRAESERIAGTETFIANGM